MVRKRPATFILTSGIDYRSYRSWNPITERLIYYTGNFTSILTVIFNRWVVDRLKLGAAETLETCLLQLDSNKGCPWAGFYSSMFMCLCSRSTTGIHSMFIEFASVTQTLRRRRIFLFCVFSHAYFWRVSTCIVSLDKYISSKINLDKIQKSQKSSWYVPPKLDTF